MSEFGDREYFAKSFNLFVKNIDHFQIENKLNSAEVCSLFWLFLIGIYKTNNVKEESFLQDAKNNFFLLGD